MEGFEIFISVLDAAMDSNRKRHIVGGLLLSVSMLFGGLALTVMTLKPEEEEENE